MRITFTQAAKGEAAFEPGTAYVLLGGQVEIAHGPQLWTGVVSAADVVEDGRAMRITVELRTR
jgi:hypothetical protein